MKDKFISIVTGQWKGKDGSSFNHTLYGLTANGKVFRFMINEGWQELKKKTVPRAVPDDDEDPF